MHRSLGFDEVHCMCNQLVVLVHVTISGKM